MARLTRAITSAAPSRHSQLHPPSERDPGRGLACGMATATLTTALQTQGSIMLALMAVSILFQTPGSRPAGTQPRSIRPPIPSPPTALSQGMQPTISLMTTTLMATGIQSPQVTTASMAARATTQSSQTQATTASRAATATIILWVTKHLRLMAKIRSMAARATIPFTAIVWKPRAAGGSLNSLGLTKALLMKATRQAASRV